MNIEPEHFTLVRDLVLERSGILLGDNKQYLVEARLRPICTREELASIGELVERLRSRPEALVEQVVEALTTNETSFFRDPHLFDALKDQVLPELVEKRADARALNIWCAASSSGQEPLSVAMTIRNALPKVAQWDVRIVATDINASILQKCREGVYSRFEVSRGLPPQLLTRFFREVDGSWKACDSILGMIDYRQLNLTEPFPPELGSLDLILVRNVLIYFETAMKASILDRMKRLLRPDGVLVLGTAESTMGLTDEFVPRLIGRTTVFEPRR